VWGFPACDCPKQDVWQGVCLAWRSLSAIRSSLSAITAYRAGTYKGRGRSLTPNGFGYTSPDKVYRPASCGLPVGSLWLSACILSYLFYFPCCGLPVGSLWALVGLDITFLSLSTDNDFLPEKNFTLWVCTTKYNNRILLQKKPIYVFHSKPLKCYYE